MKYKSINVKNCLVVSLKVPILTDYHFDFSRNLNIAPQVGLFKEEGEFNYWLHAKLLRVYNNRTIMIHTLMIMVIYFESNIIIRELAL